MNQFFKTFDFTRVSQGGLTDKATGEVSERRFYDEREWRAVCFEANERLPFTLNDVRHMIVISEEERKELGETMISLSARLDISDQTEVWSLIKVGDKIFGCLNDNAVKGADLLSCEN